MKDGPLAASKGKLMQQRMKITAEQGKAMTFKSKVSALKASILKGRDEEVKSAKEAQLKNTVLRDVQAATKMLEDIEATAASMTDSLKSKDVKKDLSAATLAGLRRKGEDAISNS